MSKKISLFVGFISFLLIMCTCNKGGSDEPDIIKVNKIELSQNSVIMKVGDQLQLIAKVLPADATDKTVKWSSSQPDVATVSSNGQISALQEGQTIITATSGNVKATCTITVQKNIIPVESLTLSKDTLLLEVGSSEILDITILPENATDKKVSWSSADESVATVSEDGLMSGIAEGTTKVTAATAEISVQCVVIVKAKIVEVTEVVISQTSLSLEEDQSATLTATVKPDNATDKTVSWSSSNTSVATVSSGGQVKAIKEGTSVITAKVGNLSAQCTVTVKRKVIEVTGITLSQTSLSLYEGKSATLTATVKPDNATDKTVSWSSSNTSVATVFSTGTVQALKEGTAVITAKSGGKTAQCTVTVKAKKEGNINVDIDSWGKVDEDYGGTVN
ncbi:Ig-like domain-containing protein [uncultured Bacteroides sp.]|uniref:Ig-like domain-containing protein n=1 Tax=uncultured Bacteroides sp. TaxID=162156 RepID=UPI002603F6F0|nr:Ig-like domain-containing protein [uncultured Bacteroides sp.]